MIRNDACSLNDMIALNPEAIVLSPGPGTPEQSGIMMDVVRQFHDKIPVLGICLGHQAIGEFYGANLVRAKRIMHGKTSQVFHDAHPVFKNIPSPLEAMRYHSLLLQNVTQTVLKVIARTEEDEIMAIVHPHHKVCGIQFHPESILTAHGLQILSNWISWIQI